MATQQTDSQTTTQSLVVASRNTVKLNAALEGCMRMFPTVTYDIRGVTVPSGVSDQPLSDLETLQGALNRAENLRALEPDAGFCFGIEGGIEPEGETFQVYAWVVVIGKSGCVGKARTALLYVPQEVAKLVREGMELGHADDKVFDRENSKQHSGLVGLLTDDVVDRSAYYTQAVILALIPFKNPSLQAKGEEPRRDYILVLAALRDNASLRYRLFMSRPAVSGSSNKLADHQPQDSEPLTGLSAAGSPLRVRKRNASLAGFDSSPVSPSIESPNQIGEEDGSGRKRPVKRACNECRQQKLRCDVVQEPFQICTRCRRLRLECKIEDNFRRVGKRSRNAEMEREIVELRKQVAQQSGILQNNGLANGASSLSIPQSAYAHDAAAGLLDLRSGIEKSPGRGPIYKRLEDVALTTERVQELHKRFFTLFNPFVPFLNPERSPDEYFQRSPLLFWTIVTIGARQYSADPELFPALIQPLTRLVWATMADVPQNYHVVKALILLCAWPLPTSSTSTDPTLMLCGLMMKIALQIGLHRPSHAQDFTKFRIELREIELQDRVVVWSVCNIVAQRICTSYGQPSMTMYDWTLGPKPIENNPNYELPAPILNRLLIEKFVDKVSRTLYMNEHDPVGLAPDNERRQYVSLLTNSLADLEDRLRKDTSPITKIYLKAASLHMWLSAFFSPPSLPSYREDMLRLYNATTEFLEACLSLENESSVSLPSSYRHGLSLACGTNYIFHMMLVAGFSLLRLMHNFLSQVESDTRGASELLTRTLWALRSMSVVENDLAERLSEVLAQVWKSGRVRAEPSHNIGDQSYDDSLQLKVKCRMSMSLVFDSVWRWRKNFKFKGGKPSEVREQNADLQVETRPASRTGLPLSRQSSNQPPASSSMVPGMAGMSTGMLDDFAMDYSQANYEVFDPLNWMLDGTVDFPYSFNPGSGMDQPGIDGMDDSM